jgi:hypothetical protein
MVNPSFNVEAEQFMRLLTLVQMRGENSAGIVTTCSDTILLRVDKRHSKAKLCMLGEDHITQVSAELNLTKEGIAKGGDFIIEIEPCMTILRRFDRHNIITVELDESGENAYLIFTRRYPFLQFKEPIEASITSLEGLNKLDDEVQLNYEVIRNALPKFNGNEYALAFTVSTNQFKELVKDGGQITSRTYPFRTEDGNLMVSIVNSDTGQAAEREIQTGFRLYKRDDDEIPVGISGVTFISAFGNVFSALQTAPVVVICLADDTPMLVFNADEEDQLQFEIILAPSVEIEEDEEIAISESIEEDILGDED